MVAEENAFIALFPSMLRRRVLEKLVIEPKTVFHLSGLAQELGVAKGALGRELTDLAAAGILTRSARGNQVTYQVNGNSRFYSELAALVRKLAGPIPKLREAVTSCVPSTRYALVYGSFARGAAREQSDIDVLIVSDDEVPLEQTASIRVMLKGVGREIDLQTVSLERLDELASESSPFLEDVVNNPLVMLVGDEDEFKSRATSGRR